MKILITGITGMVGSHLAEYVLNNHASVEVNAITRWRSPLDNIRPIVNQVKLHHADLHDLNSLMAVLEKVRPDRVFHLAAQSYVLDSFEIPADTLHVNVIGTVNLLDAIRRLSLDPLIHVCSSSEVYGQVTEDELPIKETNPFRPASPYAVSKVGVDMIAMQYYLSYGMNIIRTRMFTHTGPRRGDVFAESSFAKQIAEIEEDIHPDGIVKVGNLDSVRTISDVRDAARAYWLLLEKCSPGEVYNIGGDETMTVGDVLELLKSFSSRNIKHVVDKRLLRPSDVTMQIPDTTKFRDQTGWAPQYSVKETMKDLLEFHRELVKDWKTNR
jgi:GDPmannose 4,6-dehydratase/GDP-4-dehydro-6-deoxy-D-mannose reductase